MATEPKARKISRHALDRFYERTGRWMKDSAAEEQLWAILDVAQEIFPPPKYTDIIKHKYGEDHHSIFYACGDLVFVIVDDVVVTVHLFQREENNSKKPQSELPPGSHWKKNLKQKMQMPSAASSARYKRLKGEAFTPNLREWL